MSEEAQMTLVRYRPRRSLSSWPLFPEMSNLFGPAIEQVFEDAAEGIGWSPSVNIVEQDGELRLTAELPGMKLDDVNVEIMDGMLHLRGEKRVDVDEKKDNVRLIERRFGSFERSFTLPRSVDPEKVKAEFTDGVLTVHMPKTEGATGRKVTITGA
jgi:HSP20 family protein